MRAFKLPVLLFTATLGLSWAVQALPLSRDQARERAAALGQLGRALFFDPTLSASGAQACATCHDPAHGFGPANALPVQPGGTGMDQFAGRAAPTLSYLQAVPAFSEHFFESPEEGDESVDAGPTGGLTWDGRVDRRRDQAAIPLLAAQEMANTSPAEVVAKVAQAAYAGQMQALGGPAIFTQPAPAFALIGEALEVFQQTPALFYPYNSKYDAFLAGKVRLNAQESRGLALFQDETKGNCDSCHPSRRGADGSAPQFSDWGFVALGLPRNQQIAANADPGYFDLGLCGPLRLDLGDNGQYCGRFRTPSLRNVAMKHSFFHNGLVHDLR